MRLRAIHLFKQAGFTMAELQLLLQGDPRQDQPLLQELTDRKLLELALLSQRLQAMQQVLQSVRACGCFRLEDCPLLAD